MNTTIYLIRHSEPFKKHRGVENIKENILFSNIKTPLSVDGEKLAESISLHNEFQDLDTVWSSHYVRAMSTAKYFAYRNNLKVNIDYRFGERIHGCIDSYSELPEGFELNQFLDETLKINDGENQIEVRNRMYEALKELLETEKGKKIAIITHSTATIFLLLKWCQLQLDENRPQILFKNKIIFDKNFNYCETFKLVFNNDELLTIETLSL